MEDTWPGGETHPSLLSLSPAPHHCPLAFSFLSPEMCPVAPNHVLQEECK